MKNEEEEEIHLVPVPQKYLKLVYQTLARAMAETDRSAPPKGDSEMTTTAPTRSGTLPFQTRIGITWTPANLEKLSKGIRCPAPRKMLDMTAAQPGRPVYFKDLPPELDQLERQTRAQIGTLTKVIKREFNVGYDAANWPVDVKWDEDNALMYYIMDEEIAQRWRDITKQKGQ